MLNGPLVGQIDAKCPVVEPAFDLTYTITTNIVKQADATPAHTVNIACAQARWSHENAQTEMHYYRQNANSNC